MKIVSFYDPQIDQGEPTVLTKEVHCTISDHGK